MQACGFCKIRLCAVAIWSYVVPAVVPCLVFAEDDWSRLPQAVSFVADWACRSTLTAATDLPLEALPSQAPSAIGVGGAADTSQLGSPGVPGGARESPLQDTGEG
jgi:hypothetical protein